MNATAAANTKNTCPIVEETQVDVFTQNGAELNLMDDDEDDVFERQHHDHVTPSTAVSPTLTMKDILLNSLLLFSSIVAIALAGKHVVSSRNNTASTLLSTRSLQVGCNDSPCSVCGEEMQVGKPDALFVFPGLSPVLCGDLEDAGENGCILSAQCAFLPPFVSPICGCEPVPTPAPMTAPPMTSPPVTQPPVTQPPMTSPPVTQPPMTSPPMTSPPVTSPPVTQPPMTAPPVTSPPVTQPPMTSPPVTSPPVTQPPMTTPPVTSPPVTHPPMTSPPVTAPPASKSRKSKPPKSQKASSFVSSQMLANNGGGINAIPSHIIGATFLAYSVMAALMGAFTY